MNLLIIDTSTERGLLAYCKHSLVNQVHLLPFGLNQSKTLMSDLQKLIDSLEQPLNLEAIGVTVGPGSYTGIRIGVAVAQSLAYAWKLPLIGVPSLHGFIPEKEGNYAAVIDARIGGVYILKGKKEKGVCIYEGQPLVASIEEAQELLQECPHLVTPYAQHLQAKLKGEWTWEEKDPSAQALAISLEKQFQDKQAVYPPEQLPILYLRETEAERMKEKRLKKKEECDKEKD